MSTLIVPVFMQFTGSESLPHLDRMKVLCKTDCPKVYIVRKYRMFRFTLTNQSESSHILYSNLHYFWHLVTMHLRLKDAVRSYCQICTCTCQGEILTRLNTRVGKQFMYVMFKLALRFESSGKVT